VIKTALTAVLYMPVGRWAEHPRQGGWPSKEQNNDGSWR